MARDIPIPKWMTDFWVVFLCILIFTFCGVTSNYFLDKFHKQKVAYLENQISSLEKQAREISNLDLRKWETYNSPYLFSFKHPRNWFVDEADADRLVFRNLVNRDNSTNKLGEFDLIVDQIIDHKVLSFSEFGIQEAKESCFENNPNAECLTVNRQKKVVNNLFDMEELYLNQQITSGEDVASSVVGPIYVVDVSKYTSEGRIVVISSQGKSNITGKILNNIASSIKF